MKTVGYALITAGFLAGALIAVVEPEHVVWNRFAVALAVGFAGVALVRIGHKQTAGGQEGLAANVQALADLLERIVAGMQQLNTEKTTVNTYDMRHRIDSLLVPDIERFADMRHSITTVLGLKVYANVMSHFAAGERFLNRVWSASADGYLDEVNTCLEKSQNEFAAALRLLQYARSRAL
ncbi:MAG: hypothetical protein IH624_16050 [Phycisphaerae bacterium]|nr:hypothetical protein [Phycisphaerae bacterium]